MSLLLHRLYYVVRPLILRSLQIAARRKIAARKRERHRHIWPIDPGAGMPPLGWKGWPQARKFAFILKHDVDTHVGMGKCKDLAKLEMDLGLRSSFNFVPLRYNSKDSLRVWLSNQGFEIGVHGLYHDGKLFVSRKTFLERAEKINDFLRRWDAVGFNAPSMLRNLEWILDLDIEYDQSTFDTDPFEPQAEGVRTIFPFIYRGRGDGAGYVELPYTLPQDHCLFVILQEKDISIWKQKLDWIAEKGGMALLNTHPDYMNFGNKQDALEEYPVSHYLDFLTYVKTKYRGQYWNALPRDIARFWRATMAS